MVCGLCDNSNIGSVLSRLQSEIPFFKLIQDIAKRGIQAHCYRKRAEILLNVIRELDNKKIKNINENCYQVDCAINVNVLANKLFSALPSFEVTSVCSDGCPSTKRQWRVLMLLYENLIKENTQSSIFPHFKDTKCSNKMCQGQVKRTFTSNGKLYCSY